MTFAQREESLDRGEPVDLFTFRLGSGLTWRFTSAVEPVVIAGLTYEPETIAIGPAKSSLGESLSSTLEVTVPRNNVVANLFTDYSPSRTVSFTQQRYHIGEADTELRVVIMGVVSNARREEENAYLAVTTIGEALRRRLPWQMYQYNCNWALYSPGCGVNREDYRVEATVLSVAGPVISSAAFGLYVPRYFTNGYLERANGETRFIVKHEGNDVTLEARFSDLAGGELINAYPGCQRTEQDCNDRYNNIEHHLGWPRIPTINPFTTSVFGVGR